MEVLKEEQNLHDLLSWHSLAIVEYVGKREFGGEGILDVIRGFLDVFTVPRTGSDEARMALGYVANDYEDAMQIAAAVAGGADFLVTRDKTGFAKSPVQVVTPGELCALLGK